MRHPVTALHGHLCWTISGVAWATWRINPLAYGRRPVKEKRLVRDLHRMLLRSLQGEALLLGVVVDVDPVAVVERQIQGIDLDQCPGWAEEAEANLDRLSELSLGERSHWLAVPLANTGRHRFAAPAAAAMGRVKDELGFPRQPPGQDEIDYRLDQARRVQEAIPAPFDPRPVTVAEQVWLAAHTMRRGLQDMPPPAPGDTVSEQLLVSKSGVALPKPVLDEGAKSDHDGALGKRLNPLSSRVVKVTDPRALDLSGQPPTYQCLMVLTDTPPGGMTFPGGEVLAGLDSYPIDVDWAVRLRTNSRDKVMSANRRATNKLNEQYKQQAGDEEGDETTGRHDLDLAAKLLEEYQAELAGDRLEVEIEHTVILCVADLDAAAAQERATDLARLLGKADLKVERVLGAQEELWWLMQVGVPATRLAHSYAHYTTAGKLAMMVPFTTTHLGGRRGPVLALNTSTARLGAVHLDPGGYPELDKSGSCAFVAELGAGKSYAMKTACSAQVEMGGQFFAIDKSNEGEWAVFAASFASHAIVDPDDPHWSMDPLRILGLDQGSPVAQSFFTQLLGASPQEDAGITLAQVLNPEYLAGHELTGCGDVMDHLLKDCQLEQAEHLGRQMRNYARLHLGGIIFDQSLPPVDGTCPAIVWRTHRMEQPTPEEVGSPHLFRALPLEKVFGRAYYSLVIGCARRWAFADRTRPSALVCDEAYDIFSNPNNDRELEHFGRQGRRPKAFLLLGSHAPLTDFGTGKLRNLIPTRIVLRQTDPDLARDSVKFLGLNEADPEFETMVDDLIKNTSPVREDEGVEPGREGECFIRDAFGGLGPAKILGPAVPSRSAAVDSTPPKSRTAL